MATESNEAPKCVAIMGAASYMAGPIAKYIKQHGGYRVIGLVRATTDCSALTDEVADIVCSGDLSDVDFLFSSIRNNCDSCIAIINFINQLMPPCETVLKQLDNDLPPIMAGLEAALQLDCLFIHTSGNFSIPTAGNVGGTYSTELHAKPEKDPNSEIPVEKLEHWETFSHEGSGLQAVVALAEAKHRQDWAVQDFVTEHCGKSKACVLIPAGVYGPGIGSKFSFWDWAAAQFLEQKFVDFAHAFIHIDDIAKVYLAIVKQEFDGLSCPRFAAYGENCTVRSFSQLYASICEVPQLQDDQGPTCSEEEARRTYDDTPTKLLLGITYEHSLENDLKDTVESLRERNLLMVK